MVKTFSGFGIKLNVKTTSKQLQIFQKHLRIKSTFMDVQSLNKNNITFPESTIYLIPGIVKEVSATLVAITHNLHPSGTSLKT